MAKTIKETTIKELTDIYLKGKAAFDILDDWTDPKKPTTKRLKPGWHKVSKERAEYLVSAYPNNFTKTEPDPAVAKEKKALEKQRKALEETRKELEEKAKDLRKKEEGLNLFLKEKENQLSAKEKDLKEKEKDKTEE
jgi:hypothetical protein